MAGLQRFVTYIYEYEDGQKKDNTGYAKIEIRGTRGQIEIHFVNGGIYRGTGSVALLYAQSGRWIYVPIGEFVIENGVGNHAITFRADAIEGTEHNFLQMDGIYIIDSEGGRYLSFWRDADDLDFSETNFERYSGDMPQPEAADSVLRKPEDWVERMNDAEQESLHTMEVPMRNVFPDYAMEEIWDNCVKTKKSVQINNEVNAVQIELSELRELPKKYWSLGNNSFLLHGFFNYRHLLFGKLADGKWFVGVPGMYAGQELLMASMFGFPGFMSIGVLESEESGKREKITPREKQQGVWYHILED